MQFIDARDLGAWAVASAEAGTTGIFNTVGRPLTMAQLLDACAEVTGSDARPLWAGDEFLLDHGVEPWTDLPLWLPADTAGFLAVDTTAARGRTANATAGRHDRRGAALGRRARPRRAPRRVVAPARTRAPGPPRPPLGEDAELVLLDGHAVQMAAVEGEPLRIRFGRRMFVVRLARGAGKQAWMTTSRR